MIAPDLTGQILRHWPDLAGLVPQHLGLGFDSTALLFGDQVVRIARGKAGHSLQREQAILTLVAPQLALTVPQPSFLAGPPAMARHRLIPGIALDADLYATLPDLARQRLADDLALFHAQTHQLDPTPLRALGAAAVQPWPAPNRHLLDTVPPDLVAPAGDLLTQWLLLPPDPLGQVWGHFDAHGWNMAFDPVGQRLNGLFDFGDSGFGDLHRDLIYSALISFDLTRRIGLSYTALTARPIDIDRLRILSGAHRLWEMAASCGTDRPWLIEAFRVWLRTA